MEFVTARIKAPHLNPQTPEHIEVVLNTFLNPHGIEVECYKNNQ